MQLRAFHEASHVCDGSGNASPRVKALHAIVRAFFPESDAPSLMDSKRDNSSPRLRGEREPSISAGAVGELK